MQRCELAEECCVCNVWKCPYDDDIMVNGLFPDEYADDEDNGW